MKIIIPLIFIVMFFGFLTKRTTADFHKIIINEYRKKEFPFLSTELVMAFIDVESGFNSSAFNPESNNNPAIGLMQIRVATARDMGFRGDITELYSPATNIYYGMSYLAWLKKRFPQDLIAVIMSYNEGIGNYRKGKRVWDYYKKIIVAMEKY